MYLLLTDASGNAVFKTDLGYGALEQRQPRPAATRWTLFGRGVRDISISAMRMIPGKSMSGS